MARPLTKEARKLHRKFAPANFLIFIISLIAAVSMIILPFIDIRVHISGDKISDLLVSDGSSSQSSDGFTQTLTSALDGVELDIPINIYPVKLLKAATGSINEIDEFFDSVIGENGAAGFAEQFVGKIAPAVAKSALKASIDLDTKYDEDVDKVIAKLEGADKEGARQEFNALLDRMATEDGTDTTDMEDMFDTIVDKGTLSDGSFDFAHMMKNIDMSDVNGESSSSESSGDSSEGESTDSSSASSTANNPMSQIVQILEDPGSLITSLISQDQDLTDSLQIAFLIIFIVFVGLPAFFWAHLALAAFMRMFTQKKRVKMWYVKLFCLWAGLIVLALNLAMKYLPQLLAGTPIATIFEILSLTFLGSGVVTGICWVLLALISLFYYNRIKRKLRRLKRKEKSELY